MENPTPTEQEAIRLRWNMLHPDAPEGSAPTEEEFNVILAEIRARQKAIEDQALEMLRRATKNDWTQSGYRSRYAQAFFLYFVVPAMILFGVAWAIREVMLRR